MYNKRVENVQKKLQELGLDAFLVTCPQNVYYLTGYTGTAGYAVIDAKSIKLLTDFRYLEQAAAQAPHCEVIDIGTDFYEALAKIFNKEQIVGCEEEHLTIKQFNELNNKCSCKWTSLSGVIENIRIVKDENELQYLRQAAKIADDAFLHILNFIKPGVKEIELAAEMEHFMRKAGSEGPAFKFIIASGKRGSMPHGVASEKVIENGEMITLDFGAVYKGYHSDITRTVSVGTPDTELKNIYQLVLRAQLAGIESVCAGKTCKEIDAVAREMIAQEGYAENFRHGLGHAIGLNIHEDPRFNTKDETILKKNMVLTVEPGIYLPGKGGVRIEDAVIVTDNGCEVLTKVSKDLIIL